MSQRKVSEEEGAKLAEEYGIPFYETSAKENINVERVRGDVCLYSLFILTYTFSQAFITLARDSMERLLSDPHAGNTGGTGGRTLK